MGHALKEIWRVLVPGGALLDMRPRAARWPLYVVADKQLHFAGLADNSPGSPIDVAANQSVAWFVDKGWFSQKRKTIIDYAWDWDTLDEFQGYVKAHWELEVLLPEHLVANMQQLLTVAGNDAKVRVYLTVQLARYQKMPFT